MLSFASKNLQVVSPPLQPTLRWRKNVQKHIYISGDKLLTGNKGSKEENASIFLVFFEIRQGVEGVQFVIGVVLIGI